jgi:hypothetical protein|mmetsp:Transcript_67875/g.151598  ORF Transcript_67875/g.151598 Transcript_67875/m.151598 type:complete len:115 (-) Transcript_67875:392-736(-)
MVLVIGVYTVRTRANLLYPRVSRRARFERTACIPTPVSLFAAGAAIVLDLALPHSDDKGIAARRPKPGGVNYCIFVWSRPREFELHGSLAAAATGGADDSPSNPVVRGHGSGAQ